MLVTRMLDISQQRQQIISHNLANANTPGYIRQDLEFQTKLTQAVNRKSINEIKSVSPEVVEDFSRAPKSDGNNISSSIEVGEMMQNGIFYNLMAKAFSTKLNILKQAITGGNG